MSDKIQLNLTESTLEELRCWICKDYLSCPPIRITWNGSTVCGRCTPLNGNEIAFRQPILETIMSNATFPCKFNQNGCKLHLLFGCIINHEAECSYRTNAHSKLPKADLSMERLQAIKMEANSQFEQANVMVKQEARNEEVSLEQVSSTVSLPNWNGNFYKHGKMAEINISHSVLETFRCSLCRRYLSSAPILVLRDGNSICSVCSRLAKQPTYRELAFEAFLRKLSFPCQYKKNGCKEWISFGQVDEHEDNCAHRTCSCPTLTNCAWKGSVVEIVKHFTEKHSNLIKQNAEFKLQVDQDEEGIFIFTFDDVYFIFKYKYNATSSNLGYDVRFLPNIQEATYKIRLANNSDCDYYCAIKGGNILSYNPHFYSMQDPKTVILNNYMQVLNNPNCIVVAVNATVITKCSQENTSAEELNVDYELLQPLLCGKCRGYLVPPLYESSGPICCHCKRPNAKPLCNNELKQRVAKMNLPCRWQGCGFVGKPENLLEHDSGCQFRTFNCRDCNDTFTRADALVHLQNHGHEYFTGTFVYKMVFENTYFQKTVFTFKDNEIIFVSHNTFNRLHTVHPRRMGSCSFKIGVQFMHDHCKAESGPFSLTYGSPFTVSLYELPRCFNISEEITVIIKI